MPVLLVSRGSYSGAKTLADCLSKHAGWTCLTREDLIASVNAHGEIANQVIASVPRAAQHYAQFSLLRAPYKILMRLALLEYVRRGNMAYFGYSGHLLLPPISHVLRVRFLASMSLRIAQHQARDNFTVEQAREHIQQVDEERSRWARFVYGRNLREPELFDLCLNLDRISSPTACATLKNISEQPEFQPTPESLAAVENLYLSTRVLVALLEDPSTRTMEVAAMAKDGHITIEGPFLEDGESQKILEITGTVEGVKDVEYTEGYSHLFDLADERGEVELCRT
ncbi:MAG: cytidylate kinase family protein [Candidatus Korobacteraceae bacterium]|jgi:hypothetical protein